MSQKDNSVLNQHMIFHATAAAFVMSEKADIKILGSKENVDATLQVLQASKALYRELNNSSATLAKISELLEAKRLAASNFRNVTGIDWLL